jgi:hypothetical protein
MTRKSFAALWQRDHWRYALPAAGLSVAATALSFIPLTIGIATGAAGLPLAGLAVVAFTAGASWKALKALERGPVLDTFARDKAPQPLQDIAENLFRKAGLTCKPDVRLLRADMPRLRGMQRSVCVIPYDAENNGAIPILLGRQVSGVLSTEEITAALAHATARLMVRPHVARPSYKISRMIQASSFAAGLLAMNGPVLTLVAVTALTRRALAAHRRLQDELLADRNAMALYPHPTALATANAKVQEAVIGARRYDFSWFRQTYRAWENALFDRFVMREQRAYGLAASYEEAQAFNTKFRMPKDGRDILPPALKAAWQAERTPYFWEKVRLPAAEGNTPPLRDAWKGKPDPAAPCDADCRCKPPEPPPAP